MLSSTGDCDVTIMTACPEIATDTEISQNNTNLAKTTKSLLSSGLQFVVAMVTS